MNRTIPSAVFAALFWTFFRGGASTPLPDLWEPVAWFSTSREAQRNGPSLDPVPSVTIQSTGRPNPMDCFTVKMQGWVVSPVRKVGPRAVCSTRGRLTSWSSCPASAGGGSTRRYAELVYLQGIEMLQDVRDARSCEGSRYSSCLCGWRCHGLGARGAAIDCVKCVDFRTDSGAVVGCASWLVDRRFQVRVRSGCRSRRRRRPGLALSL
jgi:hypothetical protein